MKFFNNLGIGLKINGVIIIAILVLSAILLTLEISATNALVNDIGQVSIEQEVVVVQNRLTEAQQDLETASTVLANTPGIVESVLNEDGTSLQSLYLNASPSLFIDDFDIVNIEGERLIYADEETDGDEDLGAEDALIDQALIGIQRSTLIIEEQGEEFQLSFVSIRPIRDSNGNIVGGMLLTRVLDDEFMSLTNFGREGIELHLLYHDHIVANSDANEDLHHHEDTLDLQPAMMQSALSGNVVINPEIVYLGSSIPHTEAYIPVQGLDDRNPTAIITVHINNAAIATFQQSLQTNTVLVLVVLSLLTIFVVVTIVRSTVTQRIAQLQHATSALAQGDYSTQVTIVGKDEVGELAEAFNHMASDIQQRETSLQDLNNSLEQRVAERTAQLKEARDDALASKRIADENSRLKSEFLSMMSHELRTPMNAIEGFTGIMLNRMAGVEFNEKTERYLTKVQNNSQRLLALINDFLDLSRIESGRLELAELPMSPQDMAQKWYDNLSVLADNKGLDLRVDVDPTLPETLYGDEESLSKIAINLLGNAIKFTETGSVSLKLEKQGQNMVMEVTDTGIGIPPHAREYVFDEFRQVDMTSKRKHGGTGLGLAIVQKLARAMGGTVTLQSEVNEGSTFTVSIPIRTQKQVA